MTQELRTSLKQLRDLAPKVNKAADDAARIIREVEELLKELNIGIPAEVVVSSVPKNAEVTEYTNLAYKRIDGKFRIGVAIYQLTALPDNAQGWQVVSETPWLESPRDIKLASFDKLPDLIDVMVEEAGKAIEAVERTRPLIDKILRCAE